MIQPPRATPFPHELEIHGDVRTDPYFWLRDRENPDVITYLQQENAYTEQVLKHTESLQTDLFAEMKGRIKEDDESVPYRMRGFWYYVRYQKGQEYPIYCRKYGALEAEERILLDQNELASGHAFHALGGMSVSPDNNLLAFGEDTVSRRIYTIRFKDLETGGYLPDRLENTTGGLAWANDGKTVFYTVKDEALRPHKIYRHELGTSQEEDVEIYHETDETFTCHVFRSKSDHYLIIASSSTVSNEFRYLSTDDPTGELTLFLKRERDHEHSIAHFGEHFYILTNWNAKNFRLMRCKIGEVDRANWEEVIPHREDVLLEDIELFQHFLVLGERHKGLTQLRVKTWDGSDEHYIPFEDPAYIAYTSTNRDFETDILRFGYSSMTTPSSVFDYNMKTRERTLLKQQEVVGGHDPSAYVSERLNARASDGTEVPISIVYRVDFKRNGQGPVLLYGYGSYGHSIDPGFSSVRLSLLDRGFAFAIAHIRGGEEMGRTWYENGKLLQKKNTFTDFIACAEHLINQKYTSTKHMYAMGGSAGGMLMGAILNMRPDLWNGVVASVPFVDVVTTMLDETIPLTTGEYDEWGNPNKEEYYRYMLSYSPYDNVQEVTYPNLFVLTGLHDSQVQYWEPAKWVAKLRVMNQGDNKLLLHTNLDAGHGGASGRFESLKETAKEYAFLLDLEGITA